ncbi:interleukin 17-like protein [Babylonia areolata]|uniref:interleukin 17-like protein n=1 Tax=Babylonia areolata TaxID=304850 RepID=UPI003FD1E254
MVSASFSESSFSAGVRRCVLVAAVIGCVLCCLPMTTTAMPMKEVVGEGMSRVKGEQQQQEEHHREKRAVNKTTCAQPDNLESMFQAINSELGNTEFLGKLHNGQAISIPASEVPVEEDGDPNETKTCPTSLTTDPTAPLAHRSLCPYYFNVLNLPDGYYPSSLKTAKCKCQQCIQNDAYGCEPVLTRVAVLKPVGCHQGLQKYQEELVYVGTACTCASASTTTTPPPATTTTPWWVQ